MAAMAAATTSLRLKPYYTLRFFSFYPRTSTLTRPLIFPPILRRTFHFPSGRSRLCSVISGALHSGEAVERTKPEPPEFAEKLRGERRVGEFRKKLRIGDIKGGPDEGLKRLGQTLFMQGWVPTVRIQSSVTFIEATLIWLTMVHASQTCNA